MSRLNIKIVHRIPGRLRVRLSRAPSKVDVFLDRVAKHDGIESISFNPVSKSLLAHYTPSVVSSTEILLRMSIALSADHNNRTVQIDERHDTRKMVSIDYYSGGSIVLAALSRLVGLPESSMRLIDYNAGVSTTASVLNHAWMEVKKEGIYDPEVVSVVYLINSLIKGNYLTASAITWIATFGRHLLEPSQESCLIKALEVNQDSDQNYMDVEVRPVVDSLKPSSSLTLIVHGIARMVGLGPVKKHSLIDQIKQVSKAHHDVLEGVDSKPSPIYMRLEY